jgi:hypothetical protein
MFPAISPNQNKYINPARGSRLTSFQQHRYANFSEYHTKEHQIMLTLSPGKCEPSEPKKASNGTRSPSGAVMMSKTQSLPLLISSSPSSSIGIEGVQCPQYRWHSSFRGRPSLCPLLMPDHHDAVAAKQKREKYNTDYMRHRDPSLL